MDESRLNYNDLTVLPKLGYACMGEMVNTQMPGAQLLVVFGVEQGFRDLQQLGPEIFAGGGACDDASQSRFFAGVGGGGCLYSEDHPSGSNLELQMS